MKRMLHFEDIYCPVFIIEVDEDGLEAYLEKRIWNWHVSCCADEFKMYLKSGLPDGKPEPECYNWPDQRSKILAMSPSTEKRTDREWYEVDSIDTLLQIRIHKLKL